MHGDDCACLQGAQEPPAVASLPTTQLAAVPGDEQQDLQSGPDWQWWRETLRQGNKGTSSSTSMTLSQLAAAAEELESMPTVSISKLASA